MVRSLSLKKNVSFFSFFSAGLRTPSRLKTANDKQALSQPWPDVAKDSIKWEEGWEETILAGSVKLDLPENCTIAAAEGLHHEMEEMLAGGQDVVVNGSAVERVDTAGLQLLYSFQEALKGVEASISWSEPSASLLEASEKLGLKELLALSSV